MRYSGGKNSESCGFDPESVGAARARLSFLAQPTQKVAGSSTSSRPVAENRA